MLPFYIPMPPVRAETLFSGVKVMEARSPLFTVSVFFNDGKLTVLAQLSPLLTKVKSRGLPAAAISGEENPANTMTESEVKQAPQRRRLERERGFCMVL